MSKFKNEIYKVVFEGTFWSVSMRKFKNEIHKKWFLRGAFLAKTTVADDVTAAELFNGICSATRWVDYLPILGHLNQCNFTQKYKFNQGWYTILQNTNLSF